MELNLREHQLAVVDALRNGFKSGYRTQLLYAPTGFGKTEVAIYLMRAALQKNSRAAMLLDRIVLVDQTSQRLWKYGLDHGVFQAGHWRYAPQKLLQVCSAQTLERREDFPDLDLLIVDECHITRRQTTEYIKNNPRVRVIGLTATPFTKGLANIYENVVSGASTEFLVTNKWLTPMRVFIAKEIDMTGAKKVAGEWSQDEVTERGIKITGDIVQEWIKKTHEIFGGPRKTIVFCAGVDHGASLVQKFAEHGYNFISISYKDDDEFKAEAIKEFSKPDTNIHGLIATDILTRGFDVPDVMIGISARPFSKSLSSHIQQMGRVMRTHATKEFAVWLDHSGNYLRFREDWDDVYLDGVKELSDNGEKAKKEPTEREKKDAACPVCAHIWPRGSDICPQCGHVRQRRNQVSMVEGILEELGGNVVNERLARQSFYSELLFIATQRAYNPHWAAHKYREKFGVWPRNLEETHKTPSLGTLNWVKAKTIAYKQAMKKANG